MAMWTGCVSMAMWTGHVTVSVWTGYWGQQSRTEHWTGGRGDQGVGRCQAKHLEVQLSREMTMNCGLWKQKVQIQFYNFIMTRVKIL